MGRIGVLTGLKREAACLARFRHDRDAAPLVRLSAARPEVAPAAAEELAAAGVRGLVSFGLAGGLDPALAGGAVVLPAAVVDEGGHRWDCDAGWRRALVGQDAAACAVDRVVGVESPVAAAAAKAALWRRTGAAACDMESQHVARAAAAAGLPFVVVRAVADPAGTTLPAWTLTAIDEAGGIRPGRLLGAGLRHPGDWSALLAVGRGSGEGLRALRRLAAAAGPLLRLPRL